MSDRSGATSFKQIGNTFDKAKLFSLSAMQIEKFPIWTKAGSGDDLTFGMIPERKLAPVAMCRLALKWKSAAVVSRAGKRWGKDLEIIERLFSKDHSLVGQLKMVISVELIGVDDVPRRCEITSVQRTAEGARFSEFGLPVEKGKEIYRRLQKGLKQLQTDQAIQLTCPYGVIWCCRDILGDLRVTGFCVNCEDFDAAR